MSWGGGGGMFGAGGGGGMFGGGNANCANATSGLPFAGIPSEFREFVATLAESEEDDTRPVATFTQHAEDRRPLNLRRMFAPHWKVAVAPVLVVIEAVTFQAGPILVQIGIDHGIWDQNATVIVAVGIAPVLAVVATIAAARGRLRTTGRVSAEVMHGARVRLFAHLQRLSLDFYTGEKAA